MVLPGCYCKGKTPHAGPKPSHIMAAQCKEVATKLARSQRLGKWPSRFCQKRVPRCMTSLKKSSSEPNSQSENWCQAAHRWIINPASWVADKEENAHRSRSGFNHKNDTTGWG